MWIRMCCEYICAVLMRRFVCDGCELLREFSFGTSDEGKEGGEGLGEAGGGGRGRKSRESLKMSRRKLKGVRREERGNKICLISDG